MYWVPGRVALVKELEGRDRTGLSGGLSIKEPDDAVGRDMSFSREGWPSGYWLTVPTSPVTGALEDPLHGT